MIGDAYLYWLLRRIGVCGPQWHRDTFSQEVGLEARVGWVATKDLGIHVVYPFVGNHFAADSPSPQPSFSVCNFQVIISVALTLTQPHFTICTRRRFWFFFWRNSTPRQKKSHYARIQLYELSRVRVARLNHRKCLRRMKTGIKRYFFVHLAGKGAQAYCRTARRTVVFSHVTISMVYKKQPTDLSPNRGCS